MAGSDLIITAEGNFEPLKRGLSDLQKGAVNLGVEFQKTRAAVNAFAEAGTGVENFKTKQLQAIEAVKLFELAITKAANAGVDISGKTTENLALLKRQLAAATAEFNLYTEAVKRGYKSRADLEKDQIRLQQELANRRKELMREEVEAVRKYEAAIEAEKQGNIGKQKAAMEALTKRRKELADLTVQYTKAAVQKIAEEEKRLWSSQRDNIAEQKAAWKSLLDRRKEIARLTAEAQAAYEKKAQDAMDKTRSTAGTLLTSLKALAAGWAGMRLRNFIVQSIEAAQVMERIRLSLDTAAGSTEKGAEAFEYARRIARQYGTDLQVTAKQLGLFTAATEGFGLSMNHSRFIFEAFVKASRALGLSADDLQGIFTALQQILSKGVVQMEELRQQLGDRLPGAINFFSKAIGIPIEQLFKLTQKGLVPANESMLLFAKTINERFGPGVAAAMGGVQATIMRLKNDLFEIKAEFGKAFVFGAMEGAKELDQNLQDLKESAGDTGESLGRLAAAVAPALGVVTTGITIWSDAVTEFLRAAEAGMKFFVVGLLGVAKDTMSILKFVSDAVGRDDWSKKYGDAIDSLTAKQSEWKESTKAAWEETKEAHLKAGEHIKGVFDRLRGVHKEYEQTLIETQVAQADFDAALAVTSGIVTKEVEQKLLKAKDAAVDYVTKIMDVTAQQLKAARASGASAEEIQRLSEAMGTQIQEGNKRVSAALNNYEKLGREVPKDLQKAADSWGIVSTATQKHREEVEKIRAEYQKDIFGGGIEQLNTMADALRGIIEDQAKLWKIGPVAMAEIEKKARDLAKSYIDLGATGNEHYQKLIAILQSLGINTDKLAESNEDLKDSNKALKESSKLVTDQFREQEQAAKAAADAAKSALQKALETLAETKAEIARIESSPVSSIEDVNKAFDLRSQLPAQEAKARAARQAAEDAQAGLEGAGMMTDAARWAGQGLEGEEIGPLLAKQQQLAGNEWNQQFGPVVAPAIGAVQGLGTASVEAADGVTQFVNTLQGYVQSGFQGAAPSVPEGIRVGPTNDFGEVPPGPFAQSGIGPMYTPNEVLSPEAKGEVEGVKGIAQGQAYDLTNEMDRYSIAVAEANKHTNTMWEGMENIEESSYSAARALEATGESVVVIGGVAMTMGQLADATELYGSFAPTAAEATQEFAEAGWDAGGAYNELTSQLELMYDRTGEVATVAERVGDVFIRWGEDGKKTLTNFTAEMGLTRDEVDAVGGTVNETTEDFEYWGKSTDVVAEILKLRLNPQLSETEEFLQSLRSGTTDLGEKGVESVGQLKTAWEEIKAVIGEANALLRDHITLVQQAGGETGGGGGGGWTDEPTTDDSNPGSIQ